MEYDEDYPSESLSAHAERHGFGQRHRLQESLDVECQLVLDIDFSATVGAEEAFQGKVQRVVRYPHRMCTAEAMVESLEADELDAHHTAPTAPPHTHTSGKDGVTRHSVLVDGALGGRCSRLITSTASEQAMDRAIFGGREGGREGEMFEEREMLEERAHSTICEVLADATGDHTASDVLGSDSAARWWSWFRFQWFGHLWNSDHPHTGGSDGTLLPLTAHGNLLPDTAPGELVADRELVADTAGEHKGASDAKLFAFCNSGGLVEDLAVQSDGHETQYRRTHETQCRGRRQSLIPCIQ